MAIAPFMVVRGMTFCLAFALLFCILSISIPAWSRYPGAGMVVTHGATSTTATDDSTMYVGLFVNCLHMNDRSDSTLCFKLDFDGVPLYGDSDCTRSMTATRVLMFLGLAFLFFGVIGLHFVNKGLQANKATKSAIAVGALAFFAFVMMLAAWISWIVVGETACAGKAPIQGYSASFILAIFSCFLSLLGSLLACCLCALAKRKPPAAKEVAKEVPVLMYPVGSYPVPSYPEPVSYGPIPLPQQAPPMQYPGYEPAPPAMNNGHYSTPQVQRYAAPEDRDYDYSAPPPQYTAPADYFAAPPPQQFW